MVRQVVMGYSSTRFYVVLAVYTYVIYLYLTTPLCIIYSIPSHQQPQLPHQSMG
jgi:hypothetical protein